MLYVVICLSSICITHVHTCAQISSCTINARSPSQAPPPRASFNLCNKTLLSKLPDHIQLAFPALLTHRSGVSVDLLEGIMCDVAKKQTFLGIRDKLRTRHMEHYDKRVTQHMSQLAAAKRAALEQGEGSLSMQWWDRLDAYKLLFSPFAAPLGNAGFIPSGNLLFSRFSSFFPCSVS